MRSGGANSVAWLVWAVHMNYARGLLTGDEAHNITSVSGLFGLGLSLEQTAAVLIIACMMTMPALILRYRLPVWFVLALLLPQQLCLYLSASSCLHAMLIGQYVSGALRTPNFILADQGVYLILAWAHTMAMVAVLLRSENVTWKQVRAVFQR